MNDKQRPPLQELDNYRLEWWKPLRFDKDDGKILLLGFPLFGATLPFIGFQTLIDEDNNDMRCFVIGWFLYYLIVFMSGDRDDEE